MAARKKRKTAKPVHNETASALVGVSTELLELILVKLTHRQAAKACLTSKSIRGCVKRIREREGFAPLLVAGCERDIVDIDLKSDMQGTSQSFCLGFVQASRAGLPDWTCHRVRMGKKQRQLARSKGQVAGWLNGVAIGQAGEVFASQRKVSGIIKYVMQGLDGRVGQHFVGVGQPCSPQGLTFAHGQLYMASCGDCGLIFAIQLPPRKLKVVGIVHCGANTQPWGVTAGPDGALYVSVKDAFQAHDHVAAAPDDAPGNILRILLEDNGLMGAPGRTGLFGEVANFCKASNVANDYCLTRPRGVDFDALGRLYATSATGTVLRFHGPGRIRAGLFDKTILELQADTGSPWDVKCFMAHIVVSVSSGREEPAHDRIVVAASESGAQLKVIMSPVLRIPNALALDWRTSIEFPVRRRQTNSRIGNLTL